MAEAIQKKFHTEVEKFKQLQKDYQKALAARQTLDGQMNENALVKEEMSLLEDGAKVYKLIGPVLVKQDPEEASQNVAKRLDYIKGELKRHDDLLKDLESKQEASREAVGKLQLQLRQTQSKG
ncbi:Prefoldin subunit 6 [Amphibalanus amphitrite]|uniref:Probable prefoldin subunit 6 n=1 Tax=Amphibalanus amphitrite TaxID=1232801 RepID=A0A6A4V717_AMPAM|nr:prefoldin subunit 6-like [Amphibalanus amphitrite]XP_043230882.1 prefoldin subunit 6-like [Amphibalanus amphitrite]XP_043230883.1 prefoldin subunit 6-like [Amphibalanus amphitrite]XP_043230885.1 prefoldin subunit 6-like [Amphibalanus amphitrite]XP_043230886.1 prefoldin subunit 6-like [Amphibalanus amphitrite]XP_043241979.1 prefoldin subunit 6-like [Amphibalanus amphitrite]XP_043241980.1 prefoldin subunit 6-like [Amphibalanus amphitrite]XP_043241981.1 prefoldin subunit 6-like [Amphibalanus